RTGKVAFARRTITNYYYLVHYLCRQCQLYTDIGAAAQGHFHFVVTDGRNHQRNICVGYGEGEITFIVSGGTDGGTFYQYTCAGQRHAALSGYTTPNNHIHPFHGDGIFLDHD